MRFSAPIQTGPGADLASCTMGTGSLQGVKRGWGVALTTQNPHIAEVKERVELYICSHSGASCPVIRVTFTFTFTVCYNVTSGYFTHLPNNIDFSSYKCNGDTFPLILRYSSGQYSHK